MATLKLDEVRKSFGKTEVLHGIELDVADGEMVVLVGASGCGKSTLLRITAGLETPTSGKVLIAGRDVTPLEPADRDIAMVFQNYALYPHMTVAQNMAYGLKIRRLPRPEIDRRVREAAEILGLGALLDRRPRQLSGGQRQRVAMGRAIVREPALFLFDEPLSNLDAKLREEMQVELRELQRRVGVTTVMVTHDQHEAMALCDRVAVMQGGRLMQIDEPWRAYEEPAGEFVADFLGRSNRLPARATGQGEAEAGGHRFALPPELAAAPGDILLTIRPERLRLRPATEPGLRGEVHSRVFLGGSWLYRVDTAVGAVMVTAQNTGAAPVEEGSPVSLDWDAHSLRRLAA